MRSFIVLVLSCCFLVACSKKEEPVAPVVTQPKMPEALDEVDKALEKELTDEDFQKGKNLHGIVLRSLITGEEVKFSDHKGKKIIIDFWSSWCVPCIEMFPDIERIKKEYEEAKGLVKIISISVDPLAANARKIVKKQGVTFEVIQAPESLQNAGILLPFTIFADENGVVKETTNGKHSYAEIKKMAGLQ